MTGYFLAISEDLLTKAERSASDGFLGIGVVECWRKAIGLLEGRRFLVSLQFGQTSTKSAVEGSVARCHDFHSVQRRGSESKAEEASRDGTIRPITFQAKTRQERAGAAVLELAQTP